jgi:antitoxin component YwqK of YwqJK toxin-antitoxin module
MKIVALNKINVFISFVCLCNLFFAQNSNFSSDTVFYPSRKVKQINFHNNNMREKLIEYYENGKPKHIAVYKNNKEEGNESYFYENGKLSQEIFYQDGKRNGQASIFFKNGNLKYKAGYLNDKMNGERIYYTENGEFFNGPLLSYTEKGLIEREGNCLNGKPEGEFKVYTNGKLSMLVNFKKGKPDEETFYYSNSGKLIATELYKDGVFVKKISEPSKAKLYQGIYDLPDKIIIHKNEIDSLINNAR